MKFLATIIFLFFFLYNPIANAQDFIVGIKYGYGNGSFKKMVNSEHTASTDFNQYGISLAFSPYYSKLSLESSLEYEKDDSADYVYIPLGFRISFGKRLRLFIQGGGYYSVLLNSHTKEFIMKDDYGAHLGTGLLYAIDKRWRIEAGYYRRFGFGSPMTKKILQPVNSYITEKHKFSAYNVELAIKYRF